MILYTFVFAGQVERLSRHIKVAAGRRLYLFYNPTLSAVVGRETNDGRKKRS
jgi:hypothetical protein